LRGVEISVNGVLARRDDRLVLAGPLFVAALPLQPLGETHKVQFDRAKRQARPATPEETAAYDRLAERVGAPGDATPMRVTGPLVRVGDSWVLHVRAFQEA
jgi:hypothetical protein